MPKRCPTCESLYGDSVERCPTDDVELEPCDPEDDPLIGEDIDGRFRLDDLVGAGGMGRVYRGTQLAVDREVAVKVIRGEAVPDRTVRDRFIREAQVISGFSDPNIVRLIDFGRWDALESPYLVMEFAGGTSLGTLVENRRLHPAFAVEVARQICSGLIVAHDDGIVHRDLKLDNVHLLERGDGSFLVKILDFGIAYPQQSDLELTGTGMMCGTPAYVSPEQAQGRELDGRSDLYSLGIMLFELLTGVRPFRGDSGFELVMKQVQEPPPVLAQFVPPNEIPEALVELVGELLEKRPEDRPDSAVAVRERLDGIGDDLGVDVQLSEGEERFAPWLLEALPDEAPVHLVETAGGVDGGDVAVPEDAESKRELLESAGDSPPSAESDEREEPSEPPESEAEEVESARSAEGRERSYAGPLLAAVAVVGVAGAILFATIPQEETTGDGTSALAAAGDAGSPGADADQPPVGDVTMSVESLAGRCVGIGSNGSDVKAVYFYPEVGEMLVRHHSGVVWSKADVVGQREGALLVDYGGEAEDGRRRASIRRSGDKRTIELDGRGEFLCQREAYRPYYADLDIDGEWVEPDAGLTLSFAAVRQVLELRPNEGSGDVGRRDRQRRYRLLTGAPDARRIELAVGPGPEDRRWSVWLIEPPEGDEIEVVRRPDTSEEQVWTFRRAGDEEGERNDRAGANGAARRAGRPEPSGRRAARRGTSNQPSAEGSAEEGGASDDDSDKGAAAGDAPSQSSGSGRPPRPMMGGRQGPSEEMKKRWRKRLNQMAERCREIEEEYPNTDARAKEYARNHPQASDLEMGELRQKVAEKRRKAMQKVGQRYAQLIQEMATMGITKAELEELSTEYNEACP